MDGEGFTPLKVTLDGDGAAKDLLDRDDWQGGTLEEFIVLEGGTTGGKPSIALRVRCNDGSIVIAETTWALLYTAVRATIGRYGEPQ